MRVTNPYSENEIPDQSIRMLAKKIKSVIREKLRLDPDNIVIEGYYKSGLSRSLPIGIHFPIPKGTEWPWTSIKEELFKSINEILEDSGLGKHIDDPDVLRGQYRLSLSKASPKEGSVLIEVWPREIEKIRMNPQCAAYGPRKKRPKVANAGNPRPSRWVEFGTKVEMEHTKNKKMAQKIALDHLKESPNYYKDWKKKEKILFKSKVKNNPDLDSLRSYLNKIGGSEEDFLNIVASDYKLDDDDVETLEDIPIDIIEEALPSYVEAIKGTKVSKNPGAHFKDDDFRVDTWFERDRAYVGLVNIATNETVVEWWDDQVHEAIEDGFLNPRDYKKSALEYAKSMNLIWGENRPVKNPKKILKAHRQRISMKIKKLMKEGMKQKQAVATALSMQRAGRLGPRGGYRKNPNGVSHQTIAKVARGYNGKIHFVEQDIMIFSFEDMSLADGFIGEVSAIPTVQTYKDSIGGAALVLVFLKNHGQFQKNPVKTTLTVKNGATVFYYGWKNGKKYKMYKQHDLMLKTSRDGQSLVVKVGDTPGQWYLGTLFEHDIPSGQLSIDGNDWIWEKYPQELRSLIKAAIDKGFDVEADIQKYADEFGNAKTKYETIENFKAFMSRRSNPIKNELMAEALAALAGLLKYPERSEDVREEVLAALEAEGYWNVDRGVTEKGRKFLEEICSLEDLPE